MRKLLLLLLVLLLTACGGGGGGGVIPISAGGTGVLTVQTGNGTAAHAAAVAGVVPFAAALALVPPEPQYVRVVVKKPSDALFVPTIQDVQLGSTPSFILPVSSGYMVYCISFAKAGSLNRMLQYGEPAENATGGISISEGATTTISVAGTAITAPLINMPLVPGPAGPPQAVDGLYAGDTYTLTSPAGLSASIPTPLQANFNVAARATTDFTAYPHIPGTTVPTPSPSVKMPTATSPTTVYVLGEFYINPTFLNKGENANNWVISSPAISGPFNLYVHGGTISGGSIFADTYLPHLTSLSAPAEVNFPTSVNVAITATDNVRVAGYLITESATPPTTKPLSTDPGWQATSSFTYTFASPLAPGASTTLWAWAMDPSGNVSDAMVAGRTVTYNNLPKVTSFTLPSGVQTTTTISPISINASSFAATGITGFQITESTTPPTTWQAWTSGAPSMTGLSYTLTGLNPYSYSNIYAWVQDENGTSAPLSAFLSYDARPVVDTFTVDTSVQTTTTVAVTALSGTSYVTPATLQYLITTAGSAPTAATAGWAPSVTQYTFGTQPVGGTKVTLYAWALDANGIVSFLRKTAIVQF